MAKVNTKNEQSGPIVLVVRDNIFSRKQSPINGTRVCVRAHSMDSCRVQQVVRRLARFYGNIFCFRNQLEISLAIARSHWPSRPRCMRGDLNTPSARRRRRARRRPSVRRLAGQSNVRCGHARTRDFKLTLRRRSWARSSVKRSRRQSDDSERKRELARLRDRRCRSPRQDWDRERTIGESARSRATVFPSSARTWSVPPDGKRAAQRLCVSCSPGVARWTCDRLRRVTYLRLPIYPSTTGIRRTHQRGIPSDFQVNLRRKLECSFESEREVSREWADQPYRRDATRRFKETWEIASDRPFSDRLKVTAETDEKVQSATAAWTRRRDRGNGSRFVTIYRSVDR